MIQKHIISGEASAYKRGVVLGLTMAEILLILMFCLLFLGLIAFKEFQEANSGRDINVVERARILDEQQSIIEEKERQLTKLEDQLATREDLNNKLSESEKQIQKQDKVIKNQSETITKNQSEITNLKADIDELEEQVEVVDEIFENNNSAPIEEDWQKLIERDELITILKEKHNLSEEEIQSVLDELKSFMGNESG